MKSIKNNRLNQKDLRMNFAVMLILCISFCASAKDQEPALDLLTIFNLAEKNDPGLSSARFENQAAQELLPQGKALFLPTIVVNANVNESKVNRISETPFDSNMSYLG